jgi:hypothetical protein
MGRSSVEATKALLIRAVCATLPARLTGWTGLCFLGDVFDVGGLEVVELEEVEDGVPVSGTAVDCAKTAHALMGNVSRITRAQGAGRK